MGLQNFWVLAILLPCTFVIAYILVWTDKKPCNNGPGIMTRISGMEGKMERVGSLLEQLLARSAPKQPQEGLAIPHGALALSSLNGPPPKNTELQDHQALKLERVESLLKQVSPSIRPFPNNTELHDRLYSKMERIESLLEQLSSSNQPLPSKTEFQDLLPSKMERVESLLKQLLGTGAPKKLQDVGVPSHGTLDQSSSKQPLPKNTKLQENPSSSTAKSSKTNGVTSKETDHRKAAKITEMNAVQATKILRSNSTENTTKPLCFVDPESRLKTLPGVWEHDHSAPLYWNMSCKFEMRKRSCVALGQVQRALHARQIFKPRDCDLAELDPATLERALRGRTLHFIGDSLMKQVYIALACMLEQHIHVRGRLSSTSMNYSLPSGTPVVFTAVWTSQSKLPTPPQPGGGVAVILAGVHGGQCENLPGARCCADAAARPGCL